MAPPFQNYRLGDTLSLAVDGSNPSPNTIRVRIQELKTQTLSCTMVVEVDSKLGLVKQPVKTTFLKLYDRRFSNRLRWCNGVAPWELAMENVYVNAIQAGTVYHFLEDLHRIENFKQDTEEGWDAAQKEAFLADTLLRYYANEVAVYQALRKFQGQAIPRLIAAVDLNLTPKTTTNCSTSKVSTSSMSMGSAWRSWQIMRLAPHDRISSTKRLRQLTSLVITASWITTVSRGTSWFRPAKVAAFRCL